MPTDNRQFLLHGDTIVLNKINMLSGDTVLGDPVEFTVLSKVGEGGSSVCYEARCESDGTHGRLKEFYPVDIPEQRTVFSIERGQNNQLTTLIYADSTARAFETAREEFKAAYCTLTKAKNLEFGAVLNNYIPPFELYEGIPCEGSQFKTVYVWTRQDKRVKPFDRYIEEVKGDVLKGEGFERHLFNILNAVLTLAKCVRALHTADLLHMDLKPANFGVALDENGLVDSGNISLFDVNTVYSANNGFTHSAGTVGFRAPEVAFGRGSSRSDIYSIGATLFNVVFAADGGDALYRDEYYQRLQSLVGNAFILKNSDRNSNSKLHDILVRIFKQSLAHHPEKRYKACSYLIEDLIKARALLVPFEAENTLTELGQEIKIVNIEERFYSDSESGALGAVQRLLFEYPLYEYTTNGEIKVLVLGAGTYAQRFIDTAFAVAQNNGCRLLVTVVSDNIAADRDRYLNSRPAFSKFFTVDGILPEGVSLGEIEFLTLTKGLKFSRDDCAENLSVIKGIKQRANGFSYCFIALGDDNLNRLVAGQCQECYGLLSDECGVHYIQYKASKEVENCHAVYVGDVISGSGEYEELKRMAFNCHCLWNSSLNIDIRKLKADFMKPYNFNSSLSNALSVLYKLHSVGIDGDIDKFEAARSFRDILEKDEALVEKLAMFEHRRWLVDSICNGWDTLTDFSTLGNDNRDRRRRLHPCVVLSNAECVLNSEKWMADDRRLWDSASDSELSELDELDRVSVLMYRHFKAEAEKRLKVSEYKTDIEQIRFALRGFAEILRAFERFVLCLDGIAGGRKRQVKLYSHYRDAFKKQLKTLPSAVAQSVADNLEAIENIFYPLLQSLKYTDYKLLDRTLVEGVPFILTYSTEINLVLPVNNPWSKEASLQNGWFDIAAPMIAVDPKTATFVVDLKEFDEPKALIDCFKYTVNAADIRSLQTKINVLFANCEQTWLDRAELKQKLKQLSQRLGNVEFFEGFDEIGFLQYFSNMTNGKKSSFALRVCDGSVFEQLESAGVAELLPKFSFDSSNSVFKTDDECDYLKNINRRQCLKPRDMRNISVTDTTGNLGYFDHGYFWDIFSSDESQNVWSFLCESLKTYTEKVDTLFEFRVNDRNVTADIFIPLSLRGQVEKILNDICAVKPSLELLFGFENGNPSAVKLSVSGCEGLVHGIEQLLVKQHLLSDKKSVHVVEKGDTVTVFGSTLVVRDFVLDSSNALADGGLKLIKKLATDGYIIGFAEKDTGIDFCFPSRDEKLMLTNPELVLALSVCRGALESGRFDDCFGVFDTETHKSMREFPFDMILIKGFKSLIVECSVEPLNETVYEKLLNTYRNIGINAKPVLVCSGNMDAKGTELIKKYESLGVVTVSDREDIFTDGSIAKVLSDILS